MVNRSPTICVESLSSKDCEGKKTTDEEGSTSSSTEESTVMIEETVHGEGISTVEADRNGLNAEN